MAKRGPSRAISFAAIQPVCRRSPRLPGRRCARPTWKPGDVVAIESPAYHGILMTIAGLGMQALELPTHPADGVLPDDLERVLNRRGKSQRRSKSKIAACLLAPNFNNPPGSLMPAENKRQIVELLARHEVPLIEDDIYGDLYLEGQRPPTAKSFDGQGLVLLCSSFSKTVAPGYRIGYIAPGRFYQKVEQIKFMNTVATNSPGQATIAEYLRLDHYERHLEQMRARLRDQLDIAVNLISQSFSSGTRVSRPRGGFVLWVELPEGVDSYRLYNRALVDRISILPGLVFSNSERYRSCVRISCGHPWTPELRRALETVGRFACELVNL